MSRRLRGEEISRGPSAREAGIWEERMFPGFVGAAVWNAIALMTGSAGSRQAGTDGQPRGVEALRRWLGESGYGQQREFRGAFAITLCLLESVFQKRHDEDPWREAALQARRAWDLVLRSR